MEMIGKEVELPVKVFNLKKIQMVFKLIITQLFQQFVQTVKLVVV
jgi:hypothetical protein